MAIRINLGTIKEGTQIIDFITDSNEIGLENKLINNKIYLSIEVLKVSHQIDMKISINCVFNLICDRCLEVFDTKLDARFELVFVQKSSRENAFDDGYVRTFNPFMRYIDLTEDIRGFVLLSIPMKHLPPENSDGSCSWCGKTKEYWKNLIKENND